MYNSARIKYFHFLIKSDKEINLPNKRLMRKSDKDFS